MKDPFRNHTGIIFPAILFISFNFAFSQGSEQLSPQPQEGFLAGQPVYTHENPKSGLLFYLSGENDFRADVAAGGLELPNFVTDVSVIPGGAGSGGKGFKAEDSQLMTYWAPGNIYAQRGTISFFWRSRYPVGPTPFPIFRVAYADHSSWDMVWMRIDYNGSGFDAFVTDIGLTRTRVSFDMDKFPGPDEWTHIAFSWDETEGVRLYINGNPAASQSVAGTVYDSGLDQFGPHSRIISPYQVQSMYCFMRGGDIDELAVYDRMLSDENVAKLAGGAIIRTLAPLERSLSERRWRDAWWLRHGWNLPNNAPPVLPSPETRVRKVEIHEAYDIKRWYWKANDGIRETTWPGVYNMSRLPGRYDYFVLPDWDCYSGSGQSVKFILPDEPWNHVELWGKAWGQLTTEREMEPDNTFGVRTQKQIKSVHRLQEAQKGGIIRFDNALIEEPIGSFEVYHVDKGTAPADIYSETFTLTPLSGPVNNKELGEIASFVQGRYPADEQAMMLGVLSKEKSGKIKKGQVAESSYPFIHILIPYSDNKKAGLDGIEIRLPVMKVNPTHSGLFPVNIRIKDPLWLMRDMADFSFSVLPGDSPVLWIDTRDRVLPKGHALYITIAGAGADLSTGLLTGTQIKLVYKSKEAALTEHDTDRLTQVRDLYAMIVEERPTDSRLNLHNRLMADCSDLLSVNPENWLGQAYMYAHTGRNRPEYKIPVCPEGIPEWAFLQIEYLRHLERIASYYIDKRQIANGEFGGGLSDDGDLTNMWPGMAFLGIEPEKLLNSLLLHLDAYYDQDRPSEYAGFRQRSLPLFTNGLATIFTDELHSLEEGIQVVAQAMLLDYGNPLHIERGMETALRMLNDVTQINNVGHRHFRSRYYSGTRMATEDPWQWSVNHSYHVLQTSYLLARYNGSPKIKKMIIELADALLEHSPDGIFNTEINFFTDEHRADTGNRNKPWSLLIAAYHLTGDKKYLAHVPSTYFYKREFDQKKISDNYRQQIISLGVREYINTEGSIWIDRISSFNPLIQQDRLGGVALTRTNVLYPQYFVSWKFNAPATYESVAIYLAEARAANLEIVAYNLDKEPVSAEMCLSDIKPGKWRVRQGVDTDNDQKADSDVTELYLNLERGEKLNLNFAPRSYTIVSMEMVEPDNTAYNELPDLAVAKGDIKIDGNKVTVRVHNIGAVTSPETTVELRDAKGKLLGTTKVPPVKAPLDLKPCLAEVVITLKEIADLSHGTIRIDPDDKIRQITRSNNIVTW